MPATPIFIKALHPPAGTSFVKKSSLVSKKDAGKAAKKDDKSAAEGSPKGDLSHFHHLLGVLSTHRSGGEFGPHNVETGHHVAFRAGSLSGSGKVCATGRDGLTVQDDTSREHRIHWREITGHYAPEKKPKSGKK